eukprot:TRINITY_DN33182_c0_g1_i1.p1 TRINITY_DN33182_c0_g1~~TRINITY_DN33182_c0_g1_i1.p1  ORF type:complete len:283 (+),score=54.09 TRINITY_DN33182_c0_g1_i1:47-895(+)
MPTSVEPVFLFAGQSNMAGRCEVSLEALADLGLRLQDGECRHSSGVAFEMCWDNDSNFGAGGGHSGGKFLPLLPQAAPGLGLASCAGPEMGVAATLAPRLAAAGVSRAHFVKFAMGSTNLAANWNPGNTAAEEGTPPGKASHYPAFIAFCTAALKALRRAGGERPLAGMFWLQGESDTSKAADANAYLHNFQAFAAAVRRDVPGSGDFPIVVSPVVWHGKKLAVVNAALAQAGAGAVPACLCIDPLDASFGVQGAEGCSGHLTAEGVLDVGRRMGTALPYPS